MKIIIDTREQKKIDFQGETIIKKLEYGDYACQFEDGNMSRVIFERKSLIDLYGSLSKNYERFKKEIERSKADGSILIIIVEGSLRRILQGCVNSQRTPISIVHQLFTIRVRHGIETVFTNNREEMSNYIIHYFRALEREHDDRQQNGS